MITRNNFKKCAACVQHIFFHIPHNSDMKKHEKENSVKENKTKNVAKLKEKKTKVVARQKERMEKGGIAKQKVEKTNPEAKKKEKTSKKGSKGGFWWFFGVSAMAVGLLLVCQFFFESPLSGNEKFYENTHINGIDVGGMSVAEAENVVLTDMLNSRKEIEIELVSGDKSWVLEGNDFEVSNKIQPKIKELSKIGREGNFFQNLFKAKEMEENGRDFVVSYTSVLADIDEKLDEIVAEVEHESRPASLVFQPNGNEPFSVDMGQNTVLVNRDKLRKDIDDALMASKKVTIEIPIIEIENQIDVEALKNSVGLRSQFSTSYASSSAARKNNVKRAIESFNGMIVQPGQTISFNETTGPRTEEHGYQNAHIIVGGVYVDGVGGGVCQASTTLYNALLLADVEILSVNHHTLPASYVPLSFDAMVSGGYSDLVFKNTLENPIFIRTTADNEKISVEVYGQKLDEGVQIKRRAELVKVLPHNGDKIVADTKGEFSDKILYKGEYYRLKYPREGYESKGYLQYYKDGQLVEEKEIRHDFYPPQDGVVMEGVCVAADGMSIPASDVKIINPQKVTTMTEENVRNKLEKLSPSEYNP